MAHLVIVVDTSDSIADLNAKIQKAGNPHAALANVKNYVQAIMAGAVDADVQVTVRDTDPLVATSGSGSSQQDYLLK